MLVPDVLEESCDPLLVPSVPLCQQHTQVAHQHRLHFQAKVTEGQRLSRVRYKTLVCPEKQLSMSVTNMIHHKH